MFFKGIQNLKGKIKPAELAKSDPVFKGAGISHGNCNRATANSLSHPVTGTQSQHEALIISTEWSNNIEAVNMRLEKKKNSKEEVNGSKSLIYGETRNQLWLAFSVIL